MIQNVEKWNYACEKDRGKKTCLKENIMDCSKIMKNYQRVIKILMKRSTKSKTRFIRQ